MFAINDELQYSVYNFEMADIATLWKLFDLHEGEATRLLELYDPKAADKKRFPLLPAYDQVLKCSNLFNTLDARGAISVTERVGVIERVRKMAVGVAQALGRSASDVSGGGAMSRPLPARNRHRRNSRLDDSGARSKTCACSLRSSKSRTNPYRLDATPRRLVLRADGLPERQPDSEERVLGPPKAAPAQAVAGFARKQGVQPEDLQVESTPKGEYYTFLQEGAGPRRPRTSWPKRCPA